ncbi:MarR family winged helix-turn-helix transcriptional regulator [Paenibacillus sp. BAC0078]
MTSNYNGIMKTRDAISLISKIREKVNRLFVEELSANGIDGIVTSHGDIIYSLHNKPKMTMAEIADKIGRDKSTITALVDKLVKLGYVAKERDTKDTRVVYVTLTGKGDELKPIFEAISAKVLGVFYMHISENEKKELTRILNKIYMNF